MEWCLHTHLNQFQDKRSFSLEFPQKMVRAYEPRQKTSNLIELEFPTFKKYPVKLRVVVCLPIELLLTQFRCFFRTLPSAPYKYETFKNRYVH